MDLLAAALLVQAVPSTASAAPAAATAVLPLTIVEPGARLGTVVVLRMVGGNGNESASEYF